MNHYQFGSTYRSRYLLLAFIAYHYISRSVRNGAATQRSLLLCVLRVQFPRSAELHNAQVSDPSYADAAQQALIFAMQLSTYISSYFFAVELDGFTNTIFGFGGFFIPSPK
jgi:hypothetical protein